MITYSCLPSLAPGHNFFLIFVLMLLVSHVLAHLLPRHYMLEVLCPLLFLFYFLSLVISSTPIVSYRTYSQMTHNFYLQSWSQHLTPDPYINCLLASFECFKGTSHSASPRLSSWSSPLGLVFIQSLFQWTVALSHCLSRSQGTILSFNPHIHYQVLLISPSWIFLESTSVSTAITQVQATTISFLNNCNIPSDQSTSIHAGLPTAFSPPCC